ncbi:hypothetical protein DFH08DRAFT_191370 [Mycena albidolilacea]|uniref:Uncharacterized protein n=1 Tax=Mycena albidolilacea TaxID=1033008 RepID=A0AAD7ASZ0_9AGAR|nr:hypothetical protein DFH08DRAFT_191370 [Mycena albidolilacea]
MLLIGLLGLSGGLLGEIAISNHTSRALRSKMLFAPQVKQPGHNVNVKDNPLTEGKGVKVVTFTVLETANTPVLFVRLTVLIKCSTHITKPSLN